MCLCCDIAKQVVLPGGGFVYQDDVVMLHHCLDVPIPGYLILAPRRHVEAYSELNASEMLHLGCIGQAAVFAMQQLPGVQRVYQASFGEVAGHFHWHLFPRYQWMVEEGAAEVRTEGQVDGPKLMSYYRKTHKVRRAEFDPALVRPALAVIRRELLAFPGLQALKNNDSCEGWLC